MSAAPRQLIARRLVAVNVETFRHAEIKHAVRLKSFHVMQSFHVMRNFHANLNRSGTLRSGY
jgi:hypothetical protein